MVSEENIHADLNEVDDPKQNQITSEDKQTPVDSSENLDKESSQEQEAIPVEMVEIPKHRLEELQNAEDIALEEVKRERASVINYRKRLEKQRDDFAEIASARVLSKLLNVEDDVNRIIENGKDNIPNEHMEGIKLMAQRIKNIFDQEGVKILEVREGKTIFDPRFHEPILAQPNDELPDKTVITLVNAGFVKGERVLRPAKVIITQKTVKTNKPDEQVGDDESTENSSDVKETSSEQNSDQN